MKQIPKVLLFATIVGASSFGQAGTWSITDVEVVSSAYADGGSFSHTSNSVTYGLYNSIYTGPSSTLSKIPSVLAVYKWHIRFVKAPGDNDPSGATLQVKAHGHNIASSWGTSYSTGGYVNSLAQFDDLYCTLDAHFYKTGTWYAGGTVTDGFQTDTDLGYETAGSTNMAETSPGSGIFEGTAQATVDIGGYLEVKAYPSPVTYASANTLLDVTRTLSVVSINGQSI